MCGGLAVIADVPKTQVFELARHINRHREVIPQNTIDKPPSAELRPIKRIVIPYPTMINLIESCTRMWKKENPFRQHNLVSGRNCSQDYSIG